MDIRDDDQMETLTCYTFFVLLLDDEGWTDETYQTFTRTKPEAIASMKSHYDNLGFKILDYQDCN